MNKSELLKELRIDRDAPDDGAASRRRLWMAVAAAVVAAAGLLAWFFNRERPLEVTVTAARAMPATGAGASVLDATGYVTARRQATVSAKVTGKVREVLIEEGQRVEAGDVLATLDDSEARVDVELRRAQLAAARAQLLEAEASAANAEREFRRQQEIAELKLTSASALDAARTVAEASRARRQSQASAVRVAEESVAAAVVQLDNTVVRAPFAGVVTVKAAQEGEMVSPISAGGGFTRTGIGTIVDMSSLEVEVDVSENFINRVAAQQPATVTLNAYPDWRIPARVIAIIPTADRAKATVKVRVGFDAGDARILPEMGARVAFLDSKETSRSPATSAVAQAVLVPKESVQAEGDTGVVFVVADGGVERRTVRLGTQSESGQVVLAGLTAGTRLARGDLSSLADGSRVRVEE